MGQKVNPHGLRVGVIKDWDSRWFADKKHFGDTLVEDYNLRRDLKKQLASAGVPKIEIERDGKKVRIHIHCAKPGMIIGKGGAEIEKLRQQCEKKLGKPVAINIVEVKNPDLNAQLVAESIASQLALRSQDLSSTMRVRFRFRPCAQTSTTALPRRTPPTARSASRSGCTEARSSETTPVLSSAERDAREETEDLAEIIGKGAENNADA